MKNRSLILLTAAIALLCEACTTRHAQPELSHLTIDTMLGQKPLACQVSYRFATIVNAAKSPSLEAIEQANICYFFELEEFTGSAQQALDETVRQIGSDLASPDMPLIADTLPGMDAGQITAESEVVVVADTLLSYSILRSSFLGGAHGIYSREFHSYSLVSGHELMLSDLFSPEQIARLTQAIQTKIQEKYQAKDDQALAEAGFFPEYIASTENFEFTPSGITFHYNPYEIGCYALGAVEVNFTHEELARL